MLIRSFRDLKEALKKRMLFFDKMRCRASDHGLEYVMYVPETEENVEKIFAKRLSGKNVTREEELKFKNSVYAVCSRRIQPSWMGYAASLWMQT